MPTPIFYTLDEAAEALRISRRQLDKLLADGTLPGPDRRLGKPLLRVRALEVWAEDEAAQGPSEEWKAE